MIWMKLKKAIMPLIIAKLIILVLFIFFGDNISISRDTNYSSDYQVAFSNDSIVQKKQKFIRIVRNEEEHGISIKLRGRKNAKPVKDKEGEKYVPIAD